MEIFELPLQSYDQTFSVALGDTEYRLRLQWNRPMRAWLLSVFTAGGEEMIRGYALCTGTNVLHQYRYMGFSGTLLLAKESDTDGMPSRYDLGGESRLYYIPGDN